MANADYAGINLAIRINGAVYRAQRVRIHRHGEVGDVTSGEDLSKRRIGTVPDWEATIVKASFDITNNIYADPWNFTLFDVIDLLEIFPGGITGDPVDTLTGGLIDDFDLDMDANMLEPFTMHVVCADGSETEDGYASGQ